MIGSAAGASPAAAALANGMLCHGLDFDDTHADSICHVGVVVSPAALAVAEATGASGRELLLALVAGSEIITRIGAAAVPGYMVRGFHPTSVCGVFGAAVAAARLHALPRGADRLRARPRGQHGGRALRLPRGRLGDEAGARRLGGARRRRSPASSPRRARKGPSAVFEDRFGFFAAYYDQDAGAIETQVSDLGQRWETPRIAFKPYPACHFVHSCLDAAASLLARSPLAPDEIARITVAVPDPGVPLVLEPVEAKRDPRTEYDAKFSLQYSIAALIVHGSVGVETYTGRRSAIPPCSSWRRASSTCDATFPTYPRSFPGWVRIETRSGSVLERELAHQRGGPDNPMGRRRGRREVPRERRARARRAMPSRRSRRQSSRSSSRPTSRCFAPLRRTLPAMQRA